MSDKRPKCKNCGGQHWLSEPHLTLGVVTSSASKSNVTRGPHSAPVTLRCPECARRDAEIAALRAELSGMKQANAERQKAYRQRRGSSPTS